MVRAQQFNPLLRAILVISAVAVLVTGVTLAAIRNTVAIENISIGSADAQLRIWNGSQFAETAPGFTVNDLIPGEGTEEYFFYLFNQGVSDLNVAAYVPNEPQEPSGGYDFTGWQNLKVTFTSYEPGCEDNMVETDMQALLAGDVTLPCNPLEEGAQGNSNVQATEGNYSVSFDIDPNSVNGDDPGVGAFDLMLSGTVTADNNEEQES